MFVYSSTCFGRSPVHRQGAQWLQWQPLVLPSYRGDSSAVYVVGPVGPTTNTALLSPRYEGRPARPRTHHCYHHDTKIKPEAATAVIELPIMGWKTPETCWAVNERQDNKLKNFASGCWFIWIRFSCFRQLTAPRSVARRISWNSLPLSQMFVSI